MRVTPKSSFRVIDPGQALAGQRPSFEAGFWFFGDGQEVFSKMQVDGSDDFPDFKNG